MQAEGFGFDRPLVQTDFSERLPAKNTLTADDACVVEAAYQAVLDAVSRDAQGQPGTLAILPTDPKSIKSENENTAVNGSAGAGQDRSTTETVSPIRKELRRRNKAHLAFVAALPCLVCRRSPCDAHHLKFA